MTGDRAGTLHAYTTIVKNSQSIRETMINILELCGITDYNIVDITVMRDSSYFYDEKSTENDNLIPHDIESNVGVTAFELLDKLVKLYPYYKMYFDIYGTFTCERMITEEDDSYVVLDDKMLRNLIISETLNYDTSKVKNYIEIWGKDGHYYGEAKDLNPDSPFNVNAYPTFRYVESIDTIYDRYADIEKSVEDLNKLAEAEKTIGELTGKKDITSEEQEKLRLAKIEKSNRKSSIQSNVKYKGDDIAKDWAEQKLYEMCRMEDTVSLETVLLPFINDVGFKISYRSKLNNKVNTYKVKSVSHNLDSNTTTIEAIRFYNDQVSSLQDRLDTPNVTNISLNGMSITVSVDEVPFAEQYTLYIDHIPVATSTGTTLTYTLLEKYEGSHYVFVTASAEHFMESNGEIYTLDFSMGTFIVTNNGEVITTNNSEKIKMNEGD